MSPARIPRCARCLALAALVAGTPGPARALPLLSEVFYDALGSDDGLSFVEIHGPPGTPLDGLTIEGVNGANGALTAEIALSGAIPSDGLFVVADVGADGATAVVGADAVADFELQNGPDSVVLRAGEIALDALGYGAFGPDEVFAGEGSPAPDAPAGSSLARRFADVDSDDNAADWIVLATPTPGSAPVAVPEPRAGLLALLGLAGLARLGRPPAASRRRR